MSAQSHGQTASRGSVEVFRGTSVPLAGNWSHPPFFGGLLLETISITKACQHNVNLNKGDERKKKDKTK